VVRKMMVWLPRAAGGRGAFKALALASETGWSSLTHVINGSHAGCVEQRSQARMPWVSRGVCEYDGRLSLVFHEHAPPTSKSSSGRGAFLLYARANIAAHGSRFVQVTRSSELVTWSPFTLVEMEDYSPTEADMYFFSAQNNPVRHESTPRPLVSTLRPRALVECPVRRCSG
jgi:hypothetical protein